MQELDDEELVLGLPLLWLGTECAAAVEVEIDLVRSAACAPGKLPKSSIAMASFNSANTAIKKTKPDPSTRFAKYIFFNFPNFECWR